LTIHHLINIFSGEKQAREISCKENINLNL
jgi:hypothetical protein